MRFIVTILLLCFISLSNVNAQSTKILMTDTFLGALTGTFLGASAMALGNTENTAALRVGLGSGTLVGLGVGVYDLSQANQYGSLSINGTFSSSNTSFGIISMNTFYGAATGALVGLAIPLIINSEITDGLRIGFGLGSYAGFTYGLFDALYLNRPSGYDFDSLSTHVPSSDASGLFKVREGNLSAGFVQPEVQQFVKQGMNRFAPSVRVASFRVHL